MGKDGTHTHTHIGRHEGPASSNIPHTLIVFMVGYSKRADVVRSVTTGRLHCVTDLFLVFPLL